MTEGLYRDIRPIWLGGRYTVGEQGGEETLMGGFPSAGDTIAHD